EGIYEEVLDRLQGLTLRGKMFAHDTELGAHVLELDECSAGLGHPALYSSLPLRRSRTRCAVARASSLIARRNSSSASSSFASSSPRCSAVTRSRATRASAVLCSISRSRSVGSWDRLRIRSPLLSRGRARRGRRTGRH